MLEMYRNPLISGFTTNPTLMAKAGLHDGGTRQTADQCVRRTGGQPQIPRGDVPAARPDKRPEDDRVIHNVDVNDALADRLRHVPEVATVEAWGFSPAAFAAP